jgi:hypothetical protein
MKKLGDFLLPALAKKGLGKTVQGSLVCFYATECSDGLFEALSFSRGILKVSVSSSSAAQEVQMKEEKLVKFINDKIGAPVVKSIRSINRG